METYQDFIDRKKREIIGKKIKMKDIGREALLVFTIEDCTFMPQSNLPEKVFSIERLKKESFEAMPKSGIYPPKLAYPHAWKVGDIEYRVGYYIIGKIGKKKDIWTWGQFCPIIPEKDLENLINEAKKDGTIL